MLALYCVAHNVAQTRTGRFPTPTLLSPLPRTRLVRSKTVSNFLALRSKLQDKAATADADFFDTPSVKAGVFNTLLLPTLAVNFDYADLASPSRAAGTGLRECLNQPSVVAEPHPRSSAVGWSKGDSKRKRDREEEEGSREDRSGPLMSAAGSSVVAGPHVGLDEGSRGRKRSRGEDEQDAEDRPRRRARRQDGFLANLIHSRFMPQYLQYYL